MSLAALTNQLNELEQQGDEHAWSDQSVAAMRRAGCFRAGIPREYGGDALAPAEQMQIYEAVARGSLASALILTQHDGATQFLTHTSSRRLADDLLRRIAAGDVLTTVGISQLTTSKRGGRPPMLAHRRDDRFALNGFMPWVTSATAADYVITGAVVEEDNQQILACVPLREDLAGLDIREPMQLLALSHSHTSEIHCHDVALEPDWVLAGPTEKVLALRAPVKPLTVSSVGIGVAGALLDGIRRRGAKTPPALQAFCERAEAEYQRRHDTLYGVAEDLSDPAREIPGMAIRAEINALLIRLATTLLTLAKGTGYTEGHDAQKRAREALFFLVWSAPTQVQEATLHDIWPDGRTQSTSS